jgi:hypothetical protein
MKKFLLFSVVVAAFCAFAAVNYKSILPKTVDSEVVLSEPPPPPPPPPSTIENEYGMDWSEYEKAYGDDSKDKKSNASFSELLKLFPKGTLPYSLTANVLREQFTNDIGMTYEQSAAIKKNVLPRDFRKFFPSLDSKKFSRMPPPIGEPFLAFEADGKHVLVFVTRRGGSYYQVATFTKKGKLISERHFAHANYYDINEVLLDTNLNLFCNSYGVNWDKKPDNNGYKDCKITGLTLQRKTVESLLKEDSVKEIALEKEGVQKAKP